MRELTGRNDGKQVQAYLKVVGLTGNWPWCGAFVAWCSKMAGRLFPAGAGAAKNWFPAKRVIWDRGKATATPQPNDIIGYQFGGKRIDHVGIIEVWGTGPTVATIEGNTSGGKLDRDGQGVYRNWRFKSLVYQVARW